MPQIQISLPNGCKCSQLSVTPKNWKQVKKIAGPWRIHYRFYDPAQPGPKQVSIKQMNRLNTVEERKASVEDLIEHELISLKAGYNPFHGKIIAAHSNQKYNIEPTTLFVEALRMALARVKLEPETRKQIDKYIIPNVCRAAISLGFAMFYISEIKRKHIVYILDLIRETSEKFTDNTFNYYRKYLQILYSELVEVDAVESNIIRDIRKKAVEVKQRPTLSPDERKYLNTYLLEKSPELHNYLHIFYHSGARNTELLRLKGSDVDLPGQRFKREIKKGRQGRTVWTPIKNIALSYWIEAMQGCGPDDYVFSTNLKPGAKKMSADAIKRRWYRIVKKQFVYNAGRKSGKGKYIDRIHIINGKECKITADWYSLRHLNSTEMVDNLNEEYAATLNGHQGTGMIRKIYDTRQQERQHEKIKKVNNPF